MEEKNRSIIYINPVMQDTASITAVRITLHGRGLGGQRIPSPVDGKLSRG